MRLLLTTFAILIAACAPARAALVCKDTDGFAQPVLGSTDNDDIADVAVGLPGSDEVVVRQSQGGNVTLHGGNGFGSAVAIGDVDGDGCADVVVGTPAADNIQIFLGSATGLHTTSVASVTGAAGSASGAAIAIAQDTGLWVGAPAAEQVEHFTVAPGGGVTPAGSFQAKTPVAGERFGSRLAPGINGVYVGVPLRAHAAGGVEQIRLGLANRIYSLKGGAHRGDRFGASIATSPSGSLAVAGAPGRHHNRGAVQVLGGRLYTQSSSGVPGVARRGHRFGAAVAYGRALTCQEDGSIAAGAPGDDSVTLISTDEHCPKRFAYAHKADVGRSLGIQRYRDDFDEDIYDTLLVGAPGTGRIYRPAHGSTTLDSVKLPHTGPVVVAVAESGSAL